jgi:ATP-dependent Clp protease adapter protein ClpS
MSIAVRRALQTRNILQSTPLPLVKKTKVVVLPKLSADVPPHYKLILHNDVSFKHRHVVRVLSEVIIDMSVLEAQDKATEAYVSGRSLLRVCPKDIAFTWCKEIREQNVKTTVEPVDFF